LLPGEERIVMTKEVFVLRVVSGEEDGWDPYFLLWALCLKAVRQQWQRVALMQTNREDVGKRYREIMIPLPRTAEWAQTVSYPFRQYFTTIAQARVEFASSLATSGYEYIASAYSAGGDGKPVTDRPSKHRK
jgi:type I restriction enzyme M protein